MKTIILFLVLLSTNVLAQDDRWVLIGEGSDGTMVYYDKLTIEYDGNIVIVWEKFVNKDYEYDKTVDKYIKSTTWLNHVHCGKRKIDVKKIIFYYTDGTNRSSKFNDLPQSITPDTMTEELYNLICK